MTADADAQDAGRIGGGKGHCQIDVAGFAGRRGTGRAAGDENALKIQRGNGVLRQKAGNQQSSDARQARAVFAQQPNGWTMKPQGGYKIMEQCTFACITLHHIFIRHPGRNMKSPDGGCVFCAGAQIAFLTAAEKQCGDARAAADIQCAGAARAIELVRGEAHAVAVRCADGDMTEGLYRIDMQMNTARVQRGIELAIGLQNACFVVGRLQADEPCIRAKRRKDSFRLCESAVVGRDERNAASGCVRAAQDGVMLDGGDDGMLPGKAAAPKSAKPP